MEQAYNTPVKYIHTTKERGIRMIYSFKPLPFMKGCRCMTYHLVTVHTVIRPMYKKTNKGQRDRQAGRQTGRQTESRVNSLSRVNSPLRRHLQWAVTYSSS